MKKRFRISMGVLAMLLVAVAVLSGCGGGGAEPEPADAGAEAPAPSSGDGQAVPETVNLTFSHWMSGVAAEVLNEALQQFETDHPNVKVEQIVIPFAEYPVKIQTMMAGRTTPDLMYMSQLWFQSFAEKGAFLDLNPYTTGDAELNYADFNAELQSTGAFGGSTQMIFDGMDFISLFYNKDMFEAAGIALPNENWTWEDVVAAGKSLTKDNNGDGVLDQYGIIAPGGYVSFAWIDQNGGSVLNDERTESMLNEPNAVGALEWLNGLVNDSKIAPPPSVTKQEGTSAMFRAGKVGMAAYGPWLVGGLKAENKFEFGLTLLPQGKANRNSFVSGAGYAISKSTANQEASWELMKWLISPEVVGKFAEKGLIFPSRQSLLTPEFLSTPENAVFSEQTKYLKALPVTAKWNEMFDVYTKEADTMWMGDKSPADVAAAMDEQIDRILK